MQNNFLQIQSSKLENAILTNQPTCVIRDMYQSFLITAIGDGQHRTIDEALSFLSDDQNTQKIVASVTLRILDIENLVDCSQYNSNSRNIVRLIENKLPKFSKFRGLEGKKQTYEKFNLLNGTMDWINTQIRPLAEQYSSIASILDAKSRVIKAISHGRLGDIGNDYHLDKHRDIIISLYARLEKVNSISANFEFDIKDCETEIKNALDFANEYPSFLTENYMLPWLNCASECVSRFIEDLAGRLSAKLEQGWNGDTLLKRYPLMEIGRSTSILLPLKNVGTGAATDVKIQINCENKEIEIRNTLITMNSVNPGDFTVRIIIDIIQSCTLLQMSVEATWGEIGTSLRKSDLFLIDINSQAPDIKWDYFKYRNSYGTAPAEGSNFVGRKEHLQQLISRILRSPMEPAYITGQKRVGKTSLAKAAAVLAKQNDPEKNLAYAYILWGQIAHADPARSLQNLGEHIEQFIFKELDYSLDLKRGDYSGSLSELVSLAETVGQINPSKRFVVIIDEFDEMPEELYVHGSLAETVFANIRALTTLQNFCLLLVGGENMPFVMDRQGQKLNKFSRINLNYFNRLSEWEDYNKLVIEPSKEFLYWHDDAISEVFFLTNGNPYFTKVICSKVYDRALAEHDIDITKEEVTVGLNNELSRFDDNLFAHLWQDGIHSAISQKEPIILTRKRVLVAIARCIRTKKTITFENIISDNSIQNLPELDIKRTLADFVNREVLTDHNGSYKFVLPVFARWLTDVGIMRLAADELSRNLANKALVAEDEAAVVSSEIIELTNNWPTYRGSEIGPERVRKWLSQVDINSEQRALFNILKSIRFISEKDILTRLQRANHKIRKYAEVIIRHSLTDRRNDILVTYIDGQGKSGQKYASLFAEENFISTKCILDPSTFELSTKDHFLKFDAPKVVLIIDDIVATGKSLSSNFELFFQKNVEYFKEKNPMILIFSIFSTVDGEQFVRNKISSLGYGNLDFLAGELLYESDLIFSPGNPNFGSQEEIDKAKALAIELGTKIYKNSPLGYGNFGLNIVFPTTVPNNSLPILHSKSNSNGFIWEPLFERKIN